VHTHTHKGLEYKPTTRAFTKESNVVIVIFVVVVCIYVCVSNFTLFLSATRCGDVTCEVHFHRNHHHMLFSHIQSMSFILHALLSNEWMCFDDNSRLQLQHLPYCQLTSREKERERAGAACIIELIATHAFFLSYTLPPAVRMHPNSIDRTNDRYGANSTHNSHTVVKSFACLQCLIVLIRKPPGIHIHIHIM
jgi:hypothetical protein